MTIDDLPLELSDRIIDQLDGHIASLKSCALTRRAWLPRCRVYLHHTIRMTLKQGHPFTGHSERYCSRVLSDLVKAVDLTVMTSMLQADCNASYTRLFQHFPSLREISVHIMPFAVPAQLLSLQSPQYTSRTLPYPNDVSLTYINPYSVPDTRQLIEMLHAVPGLSRVTLKTDFSFQGGQHNLSLVDAAPRLRHVHLYPCAREDNRDAFLRALVLPDGGNGAAVESLYTGSRCTATMNAICTALGASLRELTYRHFEGV